MKQLNVIFLCIVLSTHSVYSQQVDENSVDQQYAIQNIGKPYGFWRNWSNQDGMKRSDVSIITFLQNGSLIIDGKSIFDGYQFRDFSKEDDFYKPTIREAGDGILWALNRNFGLNKHAIMRFVDKQWQTIVDLNEYPMDDLYPINRDTALGISKDSGSLFFIDASTHAVKHLISVSTQVSRSSIIRNTVFHANHGNLYVNGTDSIVELDHWREAGTGKLQLRYITPPDSFGKPNIKLICARHPGELYIAFQYEDHSRTNKIMRLFNGKWETIHVVPDNQISRVFEFSPFVPGKLNDYWMFNNNDLRYYEGDSYTPQIEPWTVSTMHYDTYPMQNGIIWTTSYYGINRWAPPLWLPAEKDIHNQPYGMEVEMFNKYNYMRRDRHAWFFRNHKQELYWNDAWINTPDIHPANVYADLNGNLWYITEDESVYVYHQNQWSKKPYQGQFDIVGADRSGLVVRTEDRQNFFLYRADSNQIISIKNPEPQIGWYLHGYYQTNETCGVVSAHYIGSGFDSLLTNHQFKEGHFELIDQMKFDGNGRRDADYDGIDTFWLALPPYVAHGIIKFHPGDSYRYTKDDGVFDTDPTLCYVMKNGDVIAGGEDGKLVRFNGESWKPFNNPTHYQIQDAIESSDGSLWLTSGPEVFRHKNGSWTTYGNEEWLPDEFIEWIAEDPFGRIAVKTGRGNTFILDPDADPDPPETIIPHDQNTRHVAPGEEAKFIFTGMDKWKYTLTERLRYSHRVDDRNWSTFTTNTVASIDGLSVGKHTFQVRAMDINMNIDPSPASWDFEILLPWYKQPAFIIMMSISVITILSLLTLLLSRYFKLEHLVTERTATLRAANEHMQTQKNELRSLTTELSIAEERERKALATDLHDSISQAVGLSIVDLNLLQGNQDRNDQENQIQKIAERLEQTLESIQSLTFELCPPILNQLGLEAAVRQLIEQFQKQHPISIELDVNHTPVASDDDIRYFLFRTVRELLHNIRKHANASHVNVYIHQENDVIHIQVSDNGIGMSPQEAQTMSKLQGGFGLFSIKERIKQMGGDLTIRSNSNQGTMVSLRVPAGPTNGINQNG